MQLNELNVYVTREKLRFESPQASRPLEMANLVAYRINDSLIDVVSVGEPPLVNPPDDVDEYSWFWCDETDDTYYVFAIKTRDFNFDNTSMFLSEVCWKFLKEDWPYEGVLKKDFENINLNIWMPDDYKEYLQGEDWLEFEYLIQSKTRISALTINGVESKWQSSDVRLARTSFFAFSLISFFSPIFIAILVFKSLPVSLPTDHLGSMVVFLCFFLAVGLIWMLVLENIINISWAILMRVFLALDLLRFAFDYHNFHDVAEGLDFSPHHWLTSKILFPKGRISW
jgi:hypothetical protein